MNNTLLKKSLKEAPIVKRGKYSYVIHPLTDGIPKIQPELLEEVTDNLACVLNDLKPFDRIVTMEAMGIPLASVLCLKMNIPFTIIRKRSYGLSTECPLKQVTGYSTSTLFINGLKEGDSIVIVDDVLSTGGTLRSVLQTLQQINVRVKGVFVVVDKGINAAKISKETGVPVHALITISITDGSIVFL